MGSTSHTYPNVPLTRESFLLILIVIFMGHPIFMWSIVRRPFVFCSFKFLKLGNIGVLFEGLSLAANNIISPSRFLSCLSLNLSFVSCVGVIIICLPSLYQSLLSSVSHIASTLSFNFSYISCETLPIAICSCSKEYSWSPSDRTCSVSLYILKYTFQILVAVALQRPRILV